MADDTLINDELERVYSLYGERTKQCGRGLYALIIAGLAVFVLLVVPYLTFRAEVADTSERLDAVADELEAAGNLIQDIGKSQVEIEDIRREQQSFAQKYLAWETYQELTSAAAKHAEELGKLRQSFAQHADKDMRAWVGGGAARPPEEIVSTNRRLAVLDQDDCYWKEGESHTTCRVCQALEETHRSVAWRLSLLKGIDQTVLDAASADLETFAGRACRWLNGEEKEHWAFGAPVSFDGGRPLRAWLTRDLRIYSERLGELSDTVRDALHEAQKLQVTLEETHATISDRLAVLEAQLERIAGFNKVGTPVGDLPVGLGQLVLLFPVVLAVGFLVVANGHARAAQTQRAFVRLCRKRDKNGEVIDALHIAAVAPAWLDSRQPRGAFVVKWGILGTPLLLALASLWLVYRTRALTTLRPDDAAISPWVYMLLYVATVALFVGTLWYLWRSGRGVVLDDAAASNGEPGNAQS